MPFTMELVKNATPFSKYVLPILKSFHLKTFGKRI
jgi:hypothetical protein